ncbi:MAG: gspF [Gemmatimonadetes bacterium]|nr:gspF [Gemmatimonadota bacterium]
MSEAAEYRYRAAQRTGTVETGSVQAASREAASDMLAARGLFPLEVVPAARAEGRSRRMSPDDLALGLRVLATLLEAGLPLARALAAMDDLVPASWRAALPGIRDAVRGGSSFAAALAAAPLALPPLVVGMVQAGEAAGSVARAVTRAAELTEGAAATGRALRNALAYPLILAVAGGSSVVLLVGVVLPRFAAILGDLGQDLPPSARLVLRLSDAVQAGWMPALATLAVLLVAWRAWTGTVGGRVAWHAFLLGVPGVGGVRRSSATARFCAALAALLESGVPIAGALTHASRAAGDAALSARIVAAREAVLGGQGLARALEDQDAATPTALRLMRAGEETGSLAPMLDRASRMEADRADQLVRTAVRLLEPALIVAFGGIVALIAGALLQAVYSVRPVL